MRKKIGKRIGPVPITLVSVLALAAFISAGLWIVPGGNQTAEAQGRGDAPAAKCVVTDNTILNPTTADPPVMDSNRPIVSLAEHCFVTGNMATVEFTNSASAEATRHIYTDGRISGGTNLKVYLNGTDPAPTAEPATAITSYYELKIPAMSQGGSDLGKASITVSRNGKPQIRLHAYPPTTDGTPPVLGTNNVLQTSAETEAIETIVFSPGLDSPDAGASSVVVNGGDEIEDDDDDALVTATFKDAASATFDMEWGDEGEDMISLNSSETGLLYDAMVGDLLSFLVPGAVITISDGDEYSREFTIGSNSRMDGALDDDESTGTTLPQDGEDITVTASLSRKVGGTVTVTVGGGEDVMLEAGLSTGKSLTMTAKQARTPGTGLKVTGLPETGNIRVEVTAELNGDTGTLTEKSYAMRSNDAVDSVSAKTYSCKQDDVVAEMMDDPADEEETIADPSKICMVEATTAKVSKLTESATFPPESKFLIIATVADSAGNPLAEKGITARQSAGPSRSAISSGSGSTGEKGMVRLVATIKGEDDADGGTYTMRVARGSVSTTVDVNVAGDVAMLSFPADKQTDPIPGNTGVGSFTVKASDVNGNLPINVGDGTDDFEALISVRPSKSIVLGENKIKFDAKTGEATFFVQVSDEAELGDTVTITVTAIGDSSVMPAVLAVTYDEVDDATDPGMTDTMDELTAPMNVDAGYVPLTGSISMSWTPGQGASRQMVVVLGSGSAVVYNMTVTADTSVHDIREGNDGEALMPGEYRLFVLSISGSNFEPSAAFAITVPAN